MYHKAMSLQSCRENIQGLVDQLGLNDAWISGPSS
jgi:hypothetical protein